MFRLCVIVHGANSNILLFTYSGTYGKLKLNVYFTKQSTHNPVDQTEKNVEYKY